LLGRHVDRAEVEDRIVGHFCQLFNRSCSVPDNTLSPNASTG
jgi:hypothetical protein